MIPEDSSESQLCTNDIIPNGMKSCIYSPRLSAPRADKGNTSKMRSLINIYTNSSTRSEFRDVKSQYLKIAVAYPLEDTMDIQDEYPYIVDPPPKPPNLPPRTPPPRKPPKSAF